MEHIIMSATLLLASVAVFQFKASSLVAQKVKLKKRR
jgi:hypothetical protein